jgi:periplasmic protein CpxP/Spy
MKNQLTSLALCTFFAAGLLVASPFAQDQSAPAPNDTAQNSTNARRDPNSQLRRLTKRLNLTADQQSQILPILSDRQQQLAVIQGDSSLSKTDRHLKIKTVRDDSSAKLRSLLTDAQKQQYDQMQEQMKELEMQRREQPKS